MALTQVEDVYYDRSRTSRQLCLYGFAFGSLTGLISLSFGIYLLSSPGANNFLSWDKRVQEFLPLLVNILVTLHNETAGYIQTVSLRWALQREGRLGFSSNLRLFSRARSAAANSWYSNLVVAFCIVLTYASASLIFVPDYDLGDESLLPPGKTTFVNGYALITLGIGILGQSTVAGACLRTMRRVPTWSSNFIDIASACLATGQIQRQPRRCLRSVHQEKLESEPVHPQSRQQSVFHAQKQARIVFYFLWASVVLAIVWATALLFVIRTSNVIQGVVNGYNWSFFPIPADASTMGTGTARDNTPEDWTPVVAIPWLIVGSRGAHGLVSWEWEEQIYFPSFVGLLALVCVLQAFITFSLHCAEILVNMIRDELMWRRASTRGIPRPAYNAFFAAITSIPAATLFALKPALHWVYGLAVSPYFSTGVLMRVPQIYYLSIGACALASFVSLCVFWRPSGPQPATFGHIQTLVNLIDEWPRNEQKMYWGRKTFDVDDGDQGSLRPSPLIQPQSEALAGDIRLSNFKAPQRIYEQYITGKPQYTSIPSAVDIQFDDSRLVAHAGTATKPLESVRFEELYS